MVDMGFQPDVFVVGILGNKAVSLIAYRGQAPVLRKLIGLQRLSYGKGTLKYQPACPHIIYLSAIKCYDIIPVPVESQFPGKGHDSTYRTSGGEGKIDPVFMRPA